jgi:hypothetical protein
MYSGGIEFSKFHRNCFINFGGPSAKINSSGILGIAQIPLDSGQNQWRTIKRGLYPPPCNPCGLQWIPVALLPGQIGRCNAQSTGLQSSPVYNIFGHALFRIVMRNGTRGNA